MLRRVTGFFATRALAQCVGILVGIVQARTLGPEGKSVLAYAAVGLSMALTATDGLNAAVLTQVGRDRLSVRLVHAALARITAVLGVPMLLLLLGIGIALPSQRPLIGAALVIPFAVYVQGTQGLFLGTGRAGMMIVQGALNSTLLGLVLIPLLIFAHFSAYAALAVWVSAWIAAAAYGLFACRTLDRAGEAPSSPEIRRAFVDQLHQGLKNGATMFSAYVNLRIDVFLVSAMLGARQLGIYTLAIACGELLWNLSLPVVWASLDRVAGAPIEEAAALVARLTRNVFVIEGAAALVCAAVGPPLIAFVYGSRFAGSGPVLELLLPGMAFYAARNLMGYFILVRLRRPLFLTLGQCVSALACAAISLATFPSLGIAGAALATSSTYCALVVVQAAVFCRATGISPGALLVPTREDGRWYAHRARTALGALARSAKTA